MSLTLILFAIQLKIKLFTTRNAACMKIKAYVVLLSESFVKDLSYFRFFVNVNKKDEKLSSHQANMSV